MPLSPNFLPKYPLIPSHMEKPPGTKMLTNNSFVDNPMMAQTMLKVSTSTENQAVSS